MNNRYCISVPCSDTFSNLRGRLSGALVQGNRRYFRGLLEQSRRQGRSLGLRRNRIRPRSQKMNQNCYLTLMSLLARCRSLFKKKTVLFFVADESCKCITLPRPYSQILGWEETNQSNIHGYPY
jgi:hypothetical protein